MASFGAILITISLGSSFLSIMVSIIGLRKQAESYIIFGRQLLNLHVLILGAAITSLGFLLITEDFSVAYVVEHTSKSLPLFFRFTALWAGAEGSILLWAFMLSLFSSIAIFQVEKKEPYLIPYMVIILMGMSLFFSILLNFSHDSDPFKVFLAGNQLMFSEDGRGLNPLLQHWAMVIHPPVLFMGYVSFAIPFAIAMASLMAGRVHLEWTRLVRRWTLFSWFTLGMGIMLGGKWAYEELGWGGYWAWDPVENASLMPWLTGTAFLHSILVQEKRGMLKVWNMILVSISFFMCIFGTFITKSGVVNSVHAFANTDIGPFLGWYLVVIVIFSAVVIVTRLDILKSDRAINSFLSREAGFLFNNVLLLAMMFTVLWGTMYPVISEILYKEKVSISAIWFNRFMGPMGMGLLFLTGAGPLLAWRKTALKTLIKNFRIPTLVFISVFCTYFISHYLKFGKINYEELHPMAGLSFGLSAFIISGVMEEFIRTTFARIGSTKENFIFGFIMIFFQNKRRYFGYAIHIGLAFLFIGFTGKAFSKETKLLLKKGEAEYFNGYLIEASDFSESVYPPEAMNNPKIAPLYTGQSVSVNVYKNEKLYKSGVTEIRSYYSFNLASGKYDSGQPTSEPAIMESLMEDVYIQFAGIDEAGNVILQVWINPLVGWVWFGFWFYNAFSLILVLPIGEGRMITIFKRQFSTTPMFQKT